MPRSRNRKYDLQDSLDWEGYTETKIKSDGNCQFRALADQIYNSVESHKRVRQEIVAQLNSHKKCYEEFVGDTFSEYVKQMSNNGVWGDHVSLQAAADLYRVKIVVICNDKDRPRFEIVPGSRKRDKVIHLSFLVEYHYNSIHLENDTASVELQSKTNDTSCVEKQSKSKKKKEKKNKKKQ